MFSPDMTLVIRVVQKIGEAIGQPVSVHRSHDWMSPTDPLLATPILYAYSPQVSMTNEPPTKVSPDPPPQGFPRGEDAYV